MREQVGGAPRVRLIRRVRQEPARGCGGGQGEPALDGLVGVLLAERLLHLRGPRLRTPVRLWFRRRPCAAFRAADTAGFAALRWKFSWPVASPWRERFATPFAPLPVCGTPRQAFPPDGLCGM